MDIEPGQTRSFIKFYSNYAVFTAADVKQTGDGGYALLGTADTYLNGKQICLIRTNAYGNYIDSTFYGRSADDQAYCLQVLSDGFAILGSSVDTTTGYKEVYFIKTNEEGETEWVKTIGSTFNVEAYHFEVNAGETAFYLVGYTEVVPVEGEDPTKDIWLFAIDHNGDDLWLSPRVYSGSKDDAGTYLQIMANGQLLVTGFTYSYPSPSANSHAFICKANSSGYRITPISTFDEYATVKGSCLKMDNNENIYLTGVMKSLADDDIMLAKLKYNDNILSISWVSHFANTGNDYGTSLFVGDDQVVILGTTAGIKNTTSISLLEADAGGNFSLINLFGTDNQMSSNTIERTSDKGFIISGTNIHSVNNMTMTLIKTKANGSL
jgi:hypothetical protein